MAWLAEMSRLRRSRRVLLAAFALATPLFAIEPQERLLAVSINRKQVSDFESVLQCGSRWFLPASFFQANRLVSSGQTPFSYNSQQYLPLDSVKGLTFSIDEQQQVLRLEASPQAFTTSLLNGFQREKYQPTLSEPGFFLNHDIQYVAGAGNNELSGLLEAGSFSRLGVFLTDVSAVSSPNGGVNMTRLSTQLVHDFPDQMTTLVVGDSISSGEMWGRPMYFAGVQYESKFATQPSFLSTPLPSISGQAAAPSTVDIYVDDIKRLSQPVDTGPFAIRDIPVMSGEGQVQMVVTDALGRSQVITQSFVNVSSVLREGVTDFAYEAGTLRTNYGRTSDQYRSGFATVSRRHGLTNALTVGYRAEVMPGKETLGGTLNYAVPVFGVIGGGAVVSMNGLRTGRMLYGDVSRSSRVLGISAHYEAADAAFWQLGLLPTEQRGRQLLQAGVNRELGKRGSIGTGVLRENLPGGQNVRALTTTASIRLGRAYLSVSSNYVTAPTRVNGVSLALVIPMGQKVNVSSTMTTGGGERSAMTEVQRSLPLGTGYGYRVTSDALNGQTDAGFYYQNQYGQWDVEGSHSGDETSWRVGERAGLVWMHDHLFETRWLQDSFAVVDVPNQPNVDVYVNNQMVGHTNQDGLAMVPWLVPYDRNNIRVDDRSVAMDTILDTSDQVVVPMWRSGLLVEFKPEQSAGATLVLQTPDGAVVPVGATAKSGSDEAEVAFHGEVFLPSLKAPATVHVSWPGHACDAQVKELPQELLPKVGPLVCQ